MHISECLQHITLISFYPLIYCKILKLTKIPISDFSQSYYSYSSIYIFMHPLMQQLMQHLMHPDAAPDAADLAAPDAPPDAAPDSP